MTASTDLSAPSALVAPAPAHSVSNGKVRSAADRVDRLSSVALAVAFAVVAVASLAAPVRRTGDAQQYVAMAAALGHGQPPSLTPAEVTAFKQWMAAQPAASGYPDAQAAIDQGNLKADGRQEFSHFWVYPLVAAPFVRLAEAMNLPLGVGFTITNLVLLGIAFAFIARVTHPSVALFLLASPLVWFVSKAQVETFTVALIGVAACLMLRGDALLAGLAVAVAATQNLPLAAGVGLCWLLALAEQLRRRRPETGTLPVNSRTRAVAIVAATIAVVALHPAYYLWRLGVVTPQELNNGFGVRVPGWERSLAVLVDPGIGLLPFMPALAAFGLWGTIRVLVSGPAEPVIDRRRAAALWAALLAAWLLFVFAQTTNVNSGGTIWVSRYALWLLPLALPLLAAVAASRPGSVTLAAAAVVSLPLSLIVFDPALPERYVTPSPQSAWLNDALPGWYHQPAELFYERAHATDGGVRGSAASPGCQTVLVAVIDRTQPCQLTAPELAAVDALLADGWDSAWVTRGGTTGFGRAEVVGAERAGS